MPVQDDERERQLLQLFNLYVPEDRRRADIDAYLKIDGIEVPFELKSSTGKSVSTVRDFGQDHIDKWRDLHWIFGFYNRAGNKLLYCHYASPADMEPWITDKERYVLPDALLATEAALSITHVTLHSILGDKEKYELDDAKWIMKKQWNAQRYLDEMDMDDGYSSSRMVDILRLRCQYVMRRGSTLNNPHIAGSYFEGWEQIIEDHAAKLRQKVRSYLTDFKAFDTESAT